MPDIVILFFALGLLARLAGSPLRMPHPVHDALSMYLLLAIGLKGGAELARQPLGDLVPEVAACVAIGLAIPVLLVPVLGALGLNRPDSASLAAHYGSVSVVTFAVATAYLDRQGIQHEEHAALWLAVMEAPALLAAILLARGAAARRGDIAGLLKEVLAGPSVMLLLGGLAIGAAAGADGLSPAKAVFIDPFKGALCLFMLELGRTVGERLGEVRQFGLRLLALGLGLPPALALLGVGAGMALGLSPGGVALLATLSGSASYIAAPTAMRMALPEANGALALTAALAISFPFNVLLGIPLYVRLGQLSG